MQKNNKPSETENRNNRATAYLQKICAMAQNPQNKIEPSQYSQLLLEVFNSKTISYREIVLTSLVAKYLDKDFNSHTNFYGCKPRAIYENPIKDFLIEHGFPCTKSGPLNIAKASNIDEAWTSQRDPKEDAEKTMILCDAISGNDSSLRQNLSLYLMRLYMSKAKEMEKLTVNIKPSSDPLVLHDLCIKLIEQAPDGGNGSAANVGVIRPSEGRRSLPEWAEIRARLTGAVALESCRDLHHVNTSCGLAARCFYG